MTNHLNLEFDITALEPLAAANPELTRKILGLYADLRVAVRKGNKELEKATA